MDTGWVRRQCKVPLTLTRSHGRQYTKLNRAERNLHLFMTFLRTKKLKYYYYYYTVQERERESARAHTHTPRAVSYTHLDVYKRQILYFLKQRLINFEN